MPNPSDYDNREDFMEACIPTLIDEGREQDEAVATCSSMWENRDKTLFEDIDWENVEIIDNTDEIVEIDPSLLRHKKKEE